MLLLLPVLCLVGACRGGGEEEDGIKPVPVTVVSPAPGPALSARRYSATLNPATKVNLSCQVSGTISSITQVAGLDDRMRNLQSGDAVTQDQSLAKVDDKIYRAQVAEAEAVVTAAKAAATQAANEHERKSELFQQEVISKAQMDVVQDQFDSANAQLAQAEHSLHEARVQLSFCDLRSPLDGSVLSCDIEVGTLVSPGVLAFALADMSSMKAVFGVPANVVVGLREGQVLTATTPTYPGRAFAGRISRRGLSADPQSRLFDVEVTLPNAEGQLKAGFVMTMQVALDGPAADGTLIPLSAVVRDPQVADGHAVFVTAKENDGLVARPRSVKLGDVVGDSILVLEGLSPDDGVIVRGATIVRDGSVVDLIR